MSADKDLLFLRQRVAEIAEEIAERDHITLKNSLSMLLSTETYNACMDVQRDYYHIPYTVLANMFCAELKLPALYDEICLP